MNVTQILNYREKNSWKDKWEWKKNTS